MSGPAAIVTGASRGIGFAIAEALAAEGFSLTVSARRPDPLSKAALTLANKYGGDVIEVAADLADEHAISKVVDRHSNRFGRLDVLVNSAGLGVAAPVGEHQTKYVDLQLQVNLRSVFLFYREAAALLRHTASEYGRALVINMASLAGKRGQPHLSVYSATKAGVVAFTEAMNSELLTEGIKSVALCPGFVATDMTAFIQDVVPTDEMIQVEDIVQAVRFILQTSSACVVPEIIMHRPHDSL